MKDDGIFMPMINDSGRNQFYKDAIEASVPGKIVVDIGTGTGLLSILAVQAGAQKVYAVERNADRVEYAANMFRKLGIRDRIILVHDDFLNTNISADVYVSETINTQIFGENILTLAEHARKHGGTFIPSQFEITLAIFEDHPIFPLCQYRSDAFEFQPDINVNSVFEQQIQQDFQQDYSLDNTLYRANILNGLFYQLPKFNDLKLNQLYKTEPLIVDLNDCVDHAQLKLTVPKEAVAHYTQDLYAVIFWKARYKNIIMDSSDTWFGNSSRTILQRVRKHNTDIVTWYDDNITDWRFSF